MVIFSSVKSYYMKIQKQGETDQISLFKAKSVDLWI